ncbi:cation:proton antiporter [Oleiphilus sp. HI0071]|jgi:multicomponent Na+:H+ antiporter subunit D|nr:monovalent cation/H+ antiporter subunit D family protein [Oleiphilus sp. HI0080]KZY60950.1 cation:proton antiporter [Oleiphilus sp. HI0065]KZY83516.1 cation:proton antiporter [Oleiphilus sp. HI0071]KZY97856.1 cation:proton antiporter [Oleiphilus sp. HI0073]KZZ50020.1 cation:proton antiporter [Oleiphilus sp. HI0122]KZZ54758.1 cation:proton antiporter [Oleiphilus sp. HI0118]KZZ70587.1 cation:proton antiporter [Oleiphilus sp. HI0130]KZZ79023.1 cation:proton antiporter [Oleiphilus sp. HI0133]
MVAEHLPILPVLIPLLAAPIAILVGRSSLAWLLSTSASIAAFFVAIGLLELTLANGAIRYALGGWSPPWGIEMRIDVASAFVLLAVSGISSLVLIYARASIEKEIKEGQHTLYYTAHLLCLAGLSGILITGDAFNLFVFLEISSLATYTLVSLASDRRCLTAAFRYLVMGTIGATFILIGVGMLYMKTGTLNMLDLGDRLQAIETSRTVNTGLAFIMVGVGIKLALFPLHMWLPGAYTHAPSAVTAFLAGTATKVAVYVMIRFIYTVFGAEHVFEEMSMSIILLALAIVGIFKCSFTAAIQSNVKTLLAYSSVAQIGYIVLGISLVSITGLTASLLHIFNHALMKGALFMAVGAVLYRVGSVEIRSFNGLGRAMPWTMAAFTIAGLSIIGVPLTVGFISKWYLVTGALEQGNWIVAFLVLLASLFAVVYIGRVLEAAYFQKLPEGVDASSIKEAPILMLLPMWVLVLANIYFGLDTELTINAASSAASALTQGSALLGGGQ